MSLQAFLNPITVENKEVIVSNRFMESGKPVPFEIRPITQAENKELMKKHTKKGKKGEETFNRMEYIGELTANAVVSPDLNNADLQKAYGTMGASNLLNKMLLVGEYMELTQAVQELSGLEKDFNDEVEEAKN